MPRHRLSRCLPLLAALTFCPAAALAQSASSADALFDKGVADMEAGRFATACPALAESQMLDPRPGTLFTLAECERKAGRIATARARYAEYLHIVAGMTGAARHNHAERAQIAEAQARALEPEVPMLTLRLPPKAPAGVRVMRDGQEVPAAELGAPQPVDPGEHVITSQAPSGSLFEQRVTLAPGERKAVDLQLENAPVAAPPPVSAPLPPASEGAEPVDGKGRFIAGLAVGGFGVAGLVVGGIAGGLAIGQKGIVVPNCPNYVCNDEGYAAVRSGTTIGTVSTVGLAVGLAGVAAGVVLVLTAPRGSKATGTSPAMRAGMLRAVAGGALFGVEGAL